MKTSQGALDLKRWDCAIPGKEKTIWESGLFKLEMQFPDGMLLLGIAIEGDSMLTHEQSTQPSHRSVRYAIMSLSARLYTDPAQASSYRRSSTQTSTHPAPSVSAF